ncbi:MAG: hypothetical protein KJ789_05305, partial [Alphaproteobacteria bacterium]|nr:hypothetical protein [Alphaproteobacteria bacterium]
PGNASASKPQPKPSSRCTSNVNPHPDQVRDDEDSGSALGRVFINKDQYFEDVSEIAWNFHIGGYQPAQKWLKDRRGRVLSWDDIGHYQKIVKILSETDRVMKEIELPLD